MISLIWSIGILLIPFVFWPWGTFTYEVPRVWFFLRWVEVLILLSTFSPLRKKISTPFDQSVFFLLLGFGAVAVISSVLGPNPIVSFLGNPYRNDGILTLLHAIALSCWLFLFGTEKLLMHTLKISLFAAVAITFLTLFELFTFQHTQGITFMQSNFLAGYLLLSLPLWIVPLKNSKPDKHRVLLTIGMLLQIVALISTQSLGAIAGLGVAVVGWWLITKKIYIGLIPLIFVSVLIFWTAAIWQQRSLETLEGRDRILAKLLVSVNERPILGWGVAGVSVAFSSNDWDIKNLNDIYLDKAHSSLLEVLVTTGLVGMVFFGAVVGKTFKSLIKKIEKSEATWQVLVLIFSLWLYHSQTNVISFAEELWFWLCVGFAGMKFRHSDKKKQKLP